MAWPSPVHIETERVVVTMPAPEDAAAALAYYVRNRDHLQPWEAEHPDGFYTEQHWQERLKASRDEHTVGQSVRLWVFERGAKAPQAIGVVNFTGIIRGAFDGCFVGYSIDQHLEGKGLMREALSASLDHVFREMDLHRVMASYMPGNIRSGRLLDTLGFAMEGYARDYLRIGGQWRDHVLTALTAPRWEEHKNGSAHG